MSFDKDLLAGPRVTNSYFAPLRRCAPLSPALMGAPFASATPAPLSVVLDVLVFAAPLLSFPNAEGDDTLGHAGRVSRRGHGDSPLHWGQVPRGHKGGS